MMHLYSIAVQPKCFTIMWGGVSPQPPPVCSIHLDDVTAVTGQRRQCAHHTPIKYPIKWGSCGLMDRALDLKPEVTQGCGFESRLWQDVSTTEVRPLSKAPRALQCRLPTAPLGCVKCREHISLLIILCIIVYVTNKAHLSLICIVSGWGLGGHD